MNPYYQPTSQNQRNILKDPQLQKEFLDLVKVHGQKNWPQIARVLKTTNDYDVKYPYRLKQIYQQLTEDSQLITSEDWTNLFRIFVHCRGDIYHGMKRFEQVSGKIVNKEKFKTLQDQGLKNGLKMFITLLSHRKKAHLRNPSRYSYKSIVLLLKCLDIEESDPVAESKLAYTITELKYAAKKLADLFLCFAENHEAERTPLYSALSKVSTRRDMEKVLTYFHYIHELKLIYLRTYTIDDDLLNHPFLLKSIVENKESDIYRKVVQERDWEEKYKLYNTITFDEDNKMDAIIPRNKASIDGGGTYKVGIFNLQTKWSVQQRNPAKLQLKTVRGKIRQPGEIVYRGWKTVVFDESDNQSDQFEENLDEEEMAYKRKKMQKLYLEAFGEEKPQKKRKEAYY